MIVVNMKSDSLEQDMKEAKRRKLFIEDSDGNALTPHEFIENVKHRMSKPLGYKLIDPRFLVEEGKKKLHEAMDRQITFEHKVVDYLKGNIK